MHALKCTWFQVSIYSCLSAWEAASHERGAYERIARNGCKKQDQYISDCEPHLQFRRPQDGAVTLHVDYQA